MKCVWISKYFRMYSLIKSNRLVGCRNLFFSKGDKFRRHLTHNYCVLCTPTHHLVSNKFIILRDSNQISINPLLVDGSDRLLGQKQLAWRSLHTSSALWSEPLKPSSKVEETVQALKEAKEQPVPVQIVPTPKKPLKQRVIDELLHYYHGFKLLFIDFNVSRKLLWKVVQGKSLTRREHKLLVRTVGDLFRLVPFSIFIIVPFLEFTLPFFIKIFPGMLPSTFQTATERDDKIKGQVKVKLEMAKFLQETLDELPVVSQGGHSSQAAKEFAQFFEKVRTTGGMTSTEEIMKFSKLFADEITLDTLPRPQLMALCRVLEINPIGLTNVLRFQLRLKLRSLTADDLMIQKEGLESLSQQELQAACRARGMRALGVSEDRLRAQLAQWLDLSLSKKVPPSLLLLSQAFMLPDSITTSEKLAQTISALPDAVGTLTKAAIGEREGKVDHKTKIDIIKEEVKAIKEERKEQLEEAEKEARQRAQLQKEELKDTAPILEDKALEMYPELRAALADLKEANISKRPDSSEISAKDIAAIDTALDLLGKHKNELMVEKEELEDLRQEMSEYQQDIVDLKKVADTSQVRETKAAKRLFKKVNKMIGKVDSVLGQLEKKKITQDDSKDCQPDFKVELQKTASDGVIKVDELLSVLQKMELDAPRLERITQVLTRIDTDKDGVVRMDTVLKIIELVGTDNVPLNQNQLDEIISLVNKEEALELDEQIAKALKGDEKVEPQPQSKDSPPESDANTQPPVEADDKTVPIQECKSPPQAVNSVAKPATPPTLKLKS